MKKYLNKVICGDCLEVMKDMPDKSVDLVLTDPPYRIHAKSGGGLHNKRNWLKNVHRDGLDNFEPNTLLNEIVRIQEKVNAYIFCSKNLLTEYISFAENNSLNWDVLIMGKNNPIPTKNNKYLSDIEFILFIRSKGAFFNNNSNFEKYKKIKMVNVKPSEYGHPTEKSLSLIGDLIEISSEYKNIVLDPFLGSGTTAVAAKQLGRNFIGIEINPGYCKIAEDRLAQYELF